MHGIADPEAIVFDEALLGQWKSAEGDQDPQELLIERDEWRTYVVTLKDRSGEAQRFTVRLVKIGSAQFFDATIHGLKEKGATDIVVFGGGIIPEEDISALKECGAKALFVPGTPIDEAVKWVRENIKPRK